MDYKYNAKHLEEELQWLLQVVEIRYKLHNGESCKYKDISGAPVPALNGHPSLYREYLQHHGFSTEERLVLVLALVPHIHPFIFDRFLGKINPGFAGSVSTMGEVAPLPTVETALFLLAGENLEKRFFYDRIFDPENLLIREDIIRLNFDLQHPSRLNARPASK